MLRFTTVQTAPSNSHTLGGGESVVRRRTEPNRTIGAVRPSPLPCISRKSLDWCSFYTSFLPLSLIAGKVCVGRGRLKYHHQRAASSCPHPDQPQGLSAPLRGKYRPTWSWRRAVLESGSAAAEANQGWKKCFLYPRYQKNKSHWCKQWQTKCNYNLHSSNNRLKNMFLSLATMHGVSCAWQW